MYRLSTPLASREGHDSIQRVPRGLRGIHSKLNGTRAEITGPCHQVSHRLSPFAKGITKMPDRNAERVLEPFLAAKDFLARFGEAHPLEIWMRRSMRTDLVPGGKPLPDLSLIH